VPEAPSAPRSDASGVEGAATTNHHEDGHEVLRLRGGVGDDAPYLDSDDEFRLQLPTPPQVVVVVPSTSHPITAEEQDSDCVAAAEEEYSDCDAAADDSDDKEMQIFVKGLQKTLCLQVMSSDTISTIEALVQKQRVCITLKVLPHVKDKKLEDGSRTLTDLDIPNEATLQMVMGLRGGGKRATIDDLLFMMFSSMF
jgi:hypothetical protein